MRRFGFLYNATDELYEQADGGWVLYSEVANLLDTAWRDATDALPEGARIVSTEHVDKGIAFCAVISEGPVRNALSYDYVPDDRVVAWGAADNPLDALQELTAKLREV